MSPTHSNRIAFSRALSFALCAALFASSAALAADKDKKKADTKATAPKLDLGLGNIGGELPKADGIEKKKATVDGVAPKTTTTDVTYEVLDVRHAFDFTRGADGVKPVGEALTAIALYGKPPTTQKFTTCVKVKASQPVSTSIELAILDPRGDTAMSGNGELNFRGAKNGELEWLIDWAPVARPSGGEYKLLVRVAGQPMGTWPLKVVEEKR